MDTSKVIAGWQTKLLQLDRRNSLLYFRGQSSSVEIIGIQPDELLDRLQKSRAGLRFPYAEPRRRTADRFEDAGGVEDQVTLGDLECDIAPLPLQRRLLNLHRKAREWEEEQGVHVLYLVLGMLHWVDEDGETAKAPLLLAPVQLVRDSPRDAWRLKLEEEDLQINETLRYQLATFGLELPQADSAIPSDYLVEISRRVSHKESWSVEPSLALANLPFAKMAMWEDLDEMRRNGTEHPVVCALGGDLGMLRPERKTPLPPLPTERELVGGGLDELLPVKEQFVVLEADHSQLRAIDLARRGDHLVIHGPPGTGKSQTIANIIATLLADGKRVLFVSEKTAALDVVKKRLEECELGCFCFDLHSSRARKESVYQQLRESHEAARNGSDTFPLAKLEEQRARLNAVVRALHETRRPLGLTMFEVHGRFAHVRSLTRVDFPLRRVEGLTSDELNAIREATGRIARRKSEFEAHATSPWRSLKRSDPSLELTDDLRKTAAIMREAVAKLQKEGDSVGQWLGLLCPESPSNVEAIGKIARHMALCTGVPEDWLDKPALERLERRSRDLATMQSDRRLLEENLKPFLGSELPELDFEGLRTHLTLPIGDQRRLKDALGTEWGQRLLPRPDLCESELRASIDCTRKLCNVATRLAEAVFGESRLDRLSSVKLVARQMRGALTTASVPESWFEPNAFSMLRARVEQTRERLAELKTAERLLFEDFEESIIDYAPPDMLVRFRADYQSRWRIFKKAYRDDQRTLRGCLHLPRKLKLDEALAAVQLASHVSRLRQEWQFESKIHAEVFGSRFQGRMTAWESLEKEIINLELWMQGWEWGVESAKRCFVGAESRSEFEPLVRDLEEALSDWESNALTSREAEPDLLLSTWLGMLDAGAEIVSRVVREGGSFWSLLRHSPSDWGQLVETLLRAAQLRRIQTNEKALAPALRKDFEGYYEGPDSDWQKAQQAIRWTTVLLDQVGGSVPAELASHCRQPRSSDQYMNQEAHLNQAAQAFKDEADSFSGTFDPRPVGWINWEEPTFDRLKSWLSWIEEHADSASGWLNYMNTVRNLQKLLAPGAVDGLRAATNDASQVPDLVLRRIYAAWIDYHCENDERLRFQPRDHEFLREEFRKLDQRSFQANRTRIRLKCFKQYPDAQATAIEWGQLGILNRQMNLKRRQMPVRRLIREIPQLLQALKPCFLMSPIAVSQFLSRSGLETDCLYFDTVIFDEASQVFPEDAVPAIARAKQVIVVGDQKQLPPTSFFRSDLPEEDDEVSSEDRLEGAESILDVLVGMAGTGVKDAYLSIHYRSRHEDLIRYSNHYFYKDRLLTFPAPETTVIHLGLKDVFLPDGRYDAGASRTNRLEAEATVQHVFEILRRRPLQESVGVVTLSRAQADLTEELINNRRLRDSSLDGRFAEELGERFFVKNLENVQGDERDHIILSLGYGPTVGSGSVPNRFGPINQPGGERRLNVAVTRARRSLTVIRSLRPEQITAENEGARLLRRFLEYLQDPVRVFEQAIKVEPEAETESPFEEAVYRALTERGHRVAKQVGCFGYRIDLAISSEDRSCYDLGIECDGATYHRAPAARDRDWLRQSVLEGLGWNIHRVWSTDWIRDPEAQIRAVERSLELARAKAKDRSKLEAGPVEPMSQRDTRVDREPNNFGQSQLSEGRRSQNVQEFQFVSYEPADLPTRYSSITLALEAPRKLCSLIVKIVEVEGPIHMDLVNERLRKYYGAGRVGPQIEKTIRTAADLAVREGRLLWLKVDGGGAENFEFLGLANLPSRPAPRGSLKDGSYRVIKHIWPGELASGLIRVVEAAFAIFREEAVVAASRSFGYARVGPEIRRTLDAIISCLVASGELVETPAGLTLPPLRQH